MRKIYQFDGKDNGIFSVGECNEYETVVICITDHNGNEAQMLLSRDSFRDLCSLSYDIQWNYRPEPEEQRLLTQAPTTQAEKEGVPF